MRQAVHGRFWKRFGALAVSGMALAASAEQASVPGENVALAPQGVRAPGTASPPPMPAVDVTAWRQPSPARPSALNMIQEREPRDRAPVEMKLAPARTGLATELKAIGIQLDNGARILLRRKDGQPALQYRQQF